MTVSAIPTPTTRTVPTELRDSLLAEKQERTEQMAMPAPKNDDVEGHAHLAAAERTLAAVDLALERWDEGTYGTCLTCASEIPLGRLELRPWAAYCVNCATV